MIVRSLVDNDYTMGGGRYAFLSGLDYCMQKSKTSLMQLRGEWFLDSRDGVEWQTLLGARTDTNEIKNVIRNTLLKVDGVISVNSVILEINNRHLSIASNITTQYGDAELNEQIEVTQ